MDGSLWWARLFLALHPELNQIVEPVAGVIRFEAAPVQADDIFLAACRVVKQGVGQLFNLHRVQSRIIEPAQELQQSAVRAAAG